jgi:hypothetical protein
VAFYCSQCPPEEIKAEELFLEKIRFVAVSGVHRVGPFLSRKSQ